MYRLSSPIHLPGVGGKWLLARLWCAVMRLAMSKGQALLVRKSNADLVAEQTETREVGAGLRRHIRRFPAARRKPELVTRTAMAAMAVDQLLEHHWIIIDGFGMANHDERPFPASAPVHVPPCTMQRNATDRRRQYRHKVLHLHKMDNPVHHGLTPRRPATSARFRALSADGANLAFDALSPLVTTCSTLHPGHSRNAW